MKKALLAWLVLLVMTVSAVGFAEGYDPSMFGETYTISDHVGAYKNEFYGFIFTNASEKWHYNIGDNLEALVKENGYTPVLQAEEKNTNRTFTFIVIPDKDDTTHETVTQVVSMLVDSIKQNFEGKAISFLGKDQLCYEAIDGQVYMGFVFLEKDSSIAVIGIQAESSDAIQDVLANFSLIQDAAESDLTPMEEKQEEPAAETAAENIPNILGAWKDSAGNSVYSNDYFGFDLTISNSSWTHYSIEDLVSQYGLMGRFVYCASNNGYQGIQMWTERIDTSKPFSMDEYLAEYKSFLEKDYESYKAAVEGKTVKFLGKEHRCVEMKFKYGNNAYYYTYIPLVRGNMIGIIKIESIAANKTSDILAKFKAIPMVELPDEKPAAEEPAAETPAEEPAEEPVSETPAEETVAEETPAADTAETASAPTETAAPAYQYIAHKKSKMFHIPTCSTVSAIPEASREYLNESRTELLDKGYTPCSRCHP